MTQHMIIPLEADFPHAEEACMTTGSNGKQASQEAGRLPPASNDASTTRREGSGPAVETALVPTDTPLPDMVRAAVAGLRQEVAAGLLYTHTRANANTSRLLEVASFLYALIELLADKGLITIAELDARKDTVATRVEQRFLAKGMGVNLQAPEQDKYAVQGAPQIDCEHRVHLCKAACCRLWFPLSRQDVDEGVMQWDLRYPYIIHQDEAGYCKHLAQATCRCTVYPHRPLPCRTFDCRHDKRIWVDFDTKVINPDLEAMFPKQPLEHNDATDQNPGRTAKQSRANADNR